MLRLCNVEFLLETQQIIVFRENFSVKHAEHTVRHAVDLGQQKKQNVLIGAVWLKLQCASWHIGIEPDLTAAEKFQPYGIDQNLFQPCRFRFDLCIALKGNIVCGHDTGTHFFYRYSAGAFSELIVPFLRPHSIPHFSFCGLFQGKGQRFRSDAAIRFPQHFHFLQFKVRVQPPFPLAPQQHPVPARHFLPRHVPVSYSCCRVWSVPSAARMPCFPVLPASFPDAVLLR